ncbi:MAG TPA: hypothetical protein V6D10_00355 [Trichocoleus sp.]|jgi:hypothetical protein
MTRTVSAPEANQVLFADKREMSRLTGLSVDTLKRYRLNGLLKENIHWVALNARTVRFCVPLVLDWMQNRNFPELHSKAIENYQALLLSYQGKAKRK